MCSKNVSFQEHSHARVQGGDRQIHESNHCRRTGEMKGGGGITSNWITHLHLEVVETKVVDKKIFSLGFGTES